ncbi:MAG: hypothetical protein IPJ30_14115 [Acidobacteria bacterium]|nr:hypothetical protein [Acidobacteriota bacterium]
MKKYIVCIARFKGIEFLEECHNAGWHVTLCHAQRSEGAAWAWTSLNGVQTVTVTHRSGRVRTITNIAEQQPIDRIVGLDQFRRTDCGESARTPDRRISGSYGLRHATSRMRNLASPNLGIPCPEFVGANRTRSTSIWIAFRNEWIVKPHEVSAFGILKCGKGSSLGPLTDLDNPTPGAISSVSDQSIISGLSLRFGVENAEIVARRHAMRTPPFTVTHMGGVFFDVHGRLSVRNCERNLEKPYQETASRVSNTNGVAHAEFTPLCRNQEFSCSKSPRVGARTTNVTECANGFNLWLNGRRSKRRPSENPYKAPKVKKEYAGICLALAKSRIIRTLRTSTIRRSYIAFASRIVGLILHSKKKDRLLNCSALTRTASPPIPRRRTGEERYDD